MQIKIGILSTALISNDFVLSLNQLDSSHYKFVAVAATKLEKAQEFASKFNISKAYGSYEELAKDDEVQLVYVANRNMYHFAASKLMIENKKHVLIEKPITVDVEKTRELFQLGKEHNVFVMEALWTRFLPAYHKVRDILRSGEIGDIIHISAHFMISNFTDRILYKRYQGGVTPDIGVYALNSIFEGVNYARPKNLKAFGRLSTPGESEVSVSAILDFEGEATATMILTSRLADKKYKDNLQEVRYIGTKGYIKINDHINCPRSIEVNGNLVDVNVKDKETRYNWPNSYGLCYQFQEARKCIMESKLTSDIHSAEHTLLLTETIRKVIAEVGAEVIETPIEFDFKSV